MNTAQQPQGAVTAIPEDSGGVSNVSEVATREGAPLPLVRALPRNQQGRDFVVGDIHGCFDLLDQLLDQVSFDPGCDRLFSVGDLIDRGPDSMRSLEFLRAPWFFAVKGNHEAMLLGSFAAYVATGQLEDLKKIIASDMWLNGGEWVAQCYEPEKLCMTLEFDELLKRVDGLPLIWVVGRGADRFHVLHSELLRSDYRESDPKVWLDVDIDRWLGGQPIDSATQDRMLWGRTLMWVLASSSLPALQPGLSPTYCGHTPASKVRRYFSHICLDTGAYQSLESELIPDSPCLTLYSVREQRQYVASF
jgi:serine/threonine protein phosphatase 1